MWVNYFKPTLKKVTEIENGGGIGGVVFGWGGIEVVSVICFPRSRVCGCGFFMIGKVGLSFVLDKFQIFQKGSNNLKIFIFPNGLSKSKNRTLHLIINININFPSHIQTYCKLHISYLHYSSILLQVYNI